MKNFIKKIPGIKNFLLFRRIIRQYPSMLKLSKGFGFYLKDLMAYRRIDTNNKFILDQSNLRPHVLDRTESTPVDPIYFYQDSWCARKVFEAKPLHHYDIGSKAEMVGIISQFTPTTMIDIRPIDLEMPNFNFIKGDILNLPFEDGIIFSLSSICVLEHIGLGRYGDKLDAFGSEKAIEEIKRVLALNGSLYISVPVDSENKIYFNAHRAFTREYILELFKPLNLIEERYIYAREIRESYDPMLGFGTGLFHFKRTK
ncbi:MAG TPA: DUF268 domain-containing protein [Candidatus Paceibacterota bacterium]|nr:DUF268 domain-containing protein [Candidatus Paceibacterota bacterium]